MSGIKVRLANTTPAVLKEVNGILVLCIGTIECRADYHPDYQPNYPQALYIEQVAKGDEHPRIYDWNLAVSKREKLLYPRTALLSKTLRNPVRVFSLNKIEEQAACLHPALSIDLYVEKGVSNFRCGLCRMRWQLGDTPEVVVRGGKILPNHTRLGWESIFGLYKLRNHSANTANKEREEQST